MSVLAERQHVSRRKMILLAVIVLVVVAAGLIVNQDPCSEGSVSHAAAGTCINPSALIVSDGSHDKIATAVAAFEGEILYSIAESQYVRLRVSSLQDLDAAKLALENAGFDVEYAIVGQLLERSPTP